MKRPLQHTNSRLDAVEAKVGDPEEVAERLGLAVRNVSFPPHGYTDMDLVKRSIRPDGLILKPSRPLTYPDYLIWELDRQGDNKFGLLLLSFRFHCISQRF